MQRKWKSAALMFSAVAAVEAFAPPKVVQGQVYWNVTTGDYGTGSNWNTSAVPGNAATADITNGGTCTISAADNAITVGNVFDGDTTAGTAMSGNILQTGGTLNVSSAGILVLGHASSLGTYNFTGGVINTLDTGNSVRLFGVASAGPSADQMWISDATGNNTGTIINSAGEFDVGYNSGSAPGAATLTMSGGTINQNNSGSEFAIGNGNGTTGIFYMTGGVLNLKSQLWVGEGTSATATGGNGAFILSGGTVTSNTWVAIGRGSTATVGNVTGVFNISGGTFTHTAPATGTGDFEVGSQGINVSATLNLLGGTLSVDHITDQSTSGTQIINFNGGVLLNNANDNNFIRQYGAATQTPILAVGNGGAIFNTSSFTVGLALTLTHSPVANATDGGLTKLGSGQFNLSGASTYTGPTVINAGTINLLGSLTSNVTVASGASIGTFNSSGSPSGSTTGSLTFLGSSSLLVNPTGAQYLTIGGAVTATGASVLVVPTIGTAPANTPTIVLDAKAGITGTFGSAGSGSNFIAGVRGTLTEQPDGSGGTDLLITAATAGPANLTWTGNAGNSTFWDVQTTPNWFNTATNGADLYYQGDNVTFDDTAGNTNVAIQGTSVSPSSVTFNNLNKTYTLTGGAIAGTTGLTVSGGGTVILDNSNSYTGATNIASGTLVVGTGGQLSPSTALSLGNGGTSGVFVLGDSNGPVNVTVGSLTNSGSGTSNEVISGNAAGSTLNVKNTGTITYSGLIGNGVAGNSTANALTLAKSGAGTLILVGSNTYTGGTNISGGTISIANASALSTGSILFGGSGVGAATNVGSGTILATANVTLANNFNFGTGAAVFNTSGNTITLTGSLTNVAGTVAQVIQPIGAGNFNLAGTFNVSGSATDVNNPALLMAGLGETTTISGSGTLGSISSGWYSSNNTLTLQPNGPLNITSTGSAFNIGQTTGNGYVYMPSGTVNIAGSLLLGAYDTSYGSFLLGNGTLNIGTNWEIAGGGNLNPNAFFQLSGGTVNVGGQTKVGWGGAGQSGLYITGGSVTSTANNFIVGSSAGSTANLTITGGTLSVVGLNVSANNQNTSGYASLNLDGGTIIETTLKTTSKGATSIVNLNGGTLQANNLSPNFLNFVTQANLYSGGVTFNSAGQSVTVPQNINTASSSAGIYNPTISNSPTGYTGIPEVAITGGGGIGATAVASVSNGVVTGITMTNPGTGYNSTPTFTLIGGGVNSSSATISATVNQNAVDGGITKIGTGTLTLSGSNTYTGNTFIKGGTLAAANSNALGTGAAILSGGSTLALTALPPLVSLNSFYTNTNSPGQGAFTPVISNNGNGSSAMLTSNLGSEATSVFSPGSSYNINDATGFTASFIYNHGTTSSFNATNGTSSSADGVTFTIQTATPNAIGSAGAALGYAGVNSSTGGIGSSVGVGVDVYLDQLEVGLNGFWNTASGAGTVPFISSSTASQVNISYSYNASAGTGTLIESITSLLDGTTYTLAPVSVDIPTLLGGTPGGSYNAFIGFTGSTGGVNDTQMVSNFSFNPNSSASVLTATNISNPVTVAAGQSAYLQLSATPGYSSGQVGPITVGAGSTLALTLGTPATGVTRGALTTSSINVTSGTLDIGPNALDITAQAGSPSASLAEVSVLVKSGYANGNWNGGGIVSSTAAADVNHLTAVGVILNDTPTNLGTPLYGVNGGLAATFDGTTPADGDVLVKFTYYGDSNLDGKVDGSDYASIDNSYASENFVNGSPTTSISGWYYGDFNYDGVVNGSDYTLMDNAFNSQGANLAAVVATQTSQIAATSAVPEPTSIGFATITAAAMLTRRSRRVRVN